MLTRRVIRLLEYRVAAADASASKEVTGYLRDARGRMTELTPWAELCERLASTSKKLDKRAWMAEYLRGLPPEVQAQAALYLAGSAFAETDSRRLSVGGAALSRVIKEQAGASDAARHAA